MCNRWPPSPAVTMWTDAVRIVLWLFGLVFACRGGAAYAVGRPELRLVSSTLASYGGGEVAKSDGPHGRRPTLGAHAGRGDNEGERISAWRGGTNAGKSHGIGQWDRWGGSGDQWGGQGDVNDAWESAKMAARER